METTESIDKCTTRYVHAIWYCYVSPIHEKYVCEFDNSRINYFKLKFVRPFHLLETAHLKLCKVQKLDLDILNSFFRFYLRTHTSDWFKDRCQQHQQQQQNLVPQVIQFFNVNDTTLPETYTAYPISLL